MPSSSSSNPTQKSALSFEQNSKKNILTNNSPNFMPESKPEKPLNLRPVIPSLNNLQGEETYGNSCTVTPKVIPEEAFGSNSKSKEQNDVPDSTQSPNECENTNSQSSIVDPEKNISSESTGTILEQYHRYQFDKLVWISNELLVRSSSQDQGSNEATLTETGNGNEEDNSIRESTSLHIDDDSGVDSNESRELLVANGETNDTCTENVDSHANTFLNITHNTDSAFSESIGSNGLENSKESINTTTPSSKLITSVYAHNFSGESSIQCLQRRGKESTKTFNTPGIEININSNSTDVLMKMVQEASIHNVSTNLEAEDENAESHGQQSSTLNERNSENHSREVRAINEVIPTTEQGLSVNDLTRPPLIRLECISPANSPLVETIGCSVPHAFSQLQTNELMNTEHSNMDQTRAQLNFEGKYGHLNHILRTKLINNVVEQRLKNQMQHPFTGKDKPQDHIENQVLERINIEQRQKDNAERMRERKNYEQRLRQKNAEQRQKDNAERMRERKNYEQRIRQRNAEQRQEQSNNPIRFPFGIADLVMPEHNPIIHKQVRTPIDATISLNVNPNANTINSAPYTSCQPADMIKSANHRIMNSHYEGAPSLMQNTYRPSIANTVPMILNTNPSANFSSNNTHPSNGMCSHPMMYSHPSGNNFHFPGSAGNVHSHNWFPFQPQFVQPPWQNFGNHSYLDTQMIRASTSLPNQINDGNIRPTRNPQGKGRVRSIRPKIQEHPNHSQQGGEEHNMRWIKLYHINNVPQEIFPLQPRCHDEVNSFRTIPPTDVSDVPVSPFPFPAIPPTEVPAIAPTEVPAIAPTEVPAIAPTEVPAIAPTEVPAIPPTEVPAIPPTEVPAIPPVGVTVIPNTPSYPIPATITTAFVGTTDQARYPLKNSSLYPNGDPIEAQGQSTGTSSQPRIPDSASVEEAYVSDDEVIFEKAIPPLNEQNVELRRMLTAYSEEPTDFNNIQMKSEQLYNQPAPCKNVPPSMPLKDVTANLPKKASLVSNTATATTILVSAGTFLSPTDKSVDMTKATLDKVAKLPSSNSLITPDSSPVKHYENSNVSPTGKDSGADVPNTNESHKIVVATIARKVPLRITHRADYSSGDHVGSNIAPIFYPSKKRWKSILNPLPPSVSNDTYNNLTEIANHSANVSTEKTNSSIASVNAESCSKFSTIMAPSTSGMSITPCLLSTESFPQSPVSARIINSHGTISKDISPASSQEVASSSREMGNYTPTLKSMLTSPPKTSRPSLTPSLIHQHCNKNEKDVANKVASAADVHDISSNAASTISLQRKRKSTFEPAPHKKTDNGLTVPVADNQIASNRGANENRVIAHPHRSNKTLTSELHFVRNYMKNDQGMTTRFGGMGYSHFKYTLLPNDPREFLNREATLLKGLHGHNTFFESLLFAMLFFTNIFDDYLIDTNECCREKFKKTQASDDSQYARNFVQYLRNEIALPARVNQAVKQKTIRTFEMSLCQMNVLHAGSLNMSTYERMILTTFFNKALHLKEFITYSQEKTSEYFHEILPDLNEKSDFTSIQLLIDKSFCFQKIQLKQTPNPAFIIKMPENGTKSYRAIIPSPLLDITDLIDGAPRQCLFCGDPAAHQCLECFGNDLIPYPSMRSTAYCDNCKNVHHKIDSLQSHISNITPLRSLPSKITKCRITLKLLAIICANRKNYSVYMKTGDGATDRWLLSRSRSNSMDSGGLPEIQEMTQDFGDDLTEFCEDKSLNSLREKFERVKSDNLKEMLRTIRYCIYTPTTPIKIEDTCPITRGLQKDFKSKDKGIVFRYD